MRFKNLTVVLGLILGIITLRIFGQEDIKQAQKRLLKKIPVPAGAIELQKIKCFPGENEDAVTLISPSSLYIDPGGDIFLVDQADHCIYVFNYEGRLQRIIGKKGQGPGELLFPRKIVGEGERVYIVDSGNSRIAKFETTGKYIDSFKVFKSYYDCAVRDGRLYLTSMGQKEEKLVDVLDGHGRLLFSFGDPPNEDYLLNWCKIAVDQERNIYIAFEHMPIIKKYSGQGQIMGEFRVNHPMAEIQEKMNLRMSKKRGRGPAVAAVIIRSIVAGKGGFFIMRDYPRMEVLFFDQHGRLRKNYWYENLDTVFYDIGVSPDQENELFYLIEKISGTVFILSSIKKGGVS